MRISIVCVCLLLRASLAVAQLSESFDYQNINDAASWKGTDTAWQLRAGRLQSRLRQQSGNFYISTPSLLARNAIWEWWLQLDFNTSSLNYTDIYLVSDSANLTGTGIRGYFVRVGNTKDDICLYRKDANGKSILLIDGRDGITDHTSTTLKIKVIRQDNEWELWTDTRANGSNYVREGSASDSTYNISRFTGFAVRQSTPSFFEKHFFDDLSISAIAADTTPPTLSSCQLINDRTLLLCFNETPDSNSLTDTRHFHIEGSDNAVSAITQDSSTPSCIRLTFKEAFPNGDSCRLIISGITDISGNVSEQLFTSFLYYTGTGYDVLIHEIMPRALPSAGLMPVRYVELKNVSARMIQLKDWRFGNRSREVLLPAYTLQPGALLVLCDRSVADKFSDISVLGLSNFPAPGDSDIITLRNENGTLIHAVGYDRSWYADPVKEKGGWSLEMLDVRWPCVGTNNWKPSLAKEGGTPGKSNSVAAQIALPGPPSLKGIFAVDSMTLQLSFSGMMDSLQVTDPEKYQSVPAIHIKKISVWPPLYNNISIELSAALLADTVYTAAVPELKDCTDQELDAVSLSFARTATADSFDVVINEILYDPAVGQPEFIEIYNRSRRAFNLEQLHLAKRNTAGEPDDITPLAGQPCILLPGRYAAFTTAPDVLCGQYHCRQPENIHKINLPSLLNQEGTVLLLNNEGQILDELHYTDKMHVGVSGSTKGVSLERLFPDKPTQDHYNWLSAAASAGHATPGYQNSQRLPVQVLPGTLTVQPRVFTPDNDGLNDLAILNYSFPSPGYVINVTIFDAEGKPVRMLERSTLLPASGYMTWDGRGDANRELVTGIYIIFAEVFHPAGNVNRWKLPIVLGRKTNP